MLLTGCGWTLTTTTEAPADSMPLAPLTSTPTGIEAPGLNEALSVEAEPMQVDDIVMIGDSITVGSTPQLEEAFSDIGFDNVLIVSQNGKRIDRNADGNPSGVSVAQFLTAEPLDRSSELWVVALGTNDVNQYLEVDLRVAVADMLAAVPAESPLVWVETFFGTQPDGASLVNEIIAELLAERGNATIARWSAVADRAVASREDVVRSDGVHLYEPGNELFAKTVVEAVDDFIRG